MSVFIGSIGICLSWGQDGKPLQWGKITTSPSGESREESLTSLINPITVKVSKFKTSNKTPTRKPREPRGAACSEELIWLTADGSVQPATKWNQQQNQVNEYQTNPLNRILGNRNWVLPRNCCKSYGEMVIYTAKDQSAWQTYCGNPCLVPASFLLLGWNLKNVSLLYISHQHKPEKRITPQTKFGNWLRGMPKRVGNWTQAHC